MKRIMAAVIDSTITMLLSLMILVFVVMTKGKLFASIAITNFIYFFVTDYFCNGYSLGKRLIKVHVVLQKSSKYGYLRSCFIHSFFRAAISFCWPLGLFIFVICGYKMPYDKIVYENLE